MQVDKVDKRSAYVLEYNSASSRIDMQASDARFWCVCAIVARLRPSSAQDVFLLNVLHTWAITALKSNAKDRDAQCLVGRDSSGKLHRVTLLTLSLYVNLCSDISDDKRRTASIMHSQEYGIRRGVTGDLSTRRSVQMTDQIFWVFVDRYRDAVAPRARSPYEGFATPWAA